MSNEEIGFLFKAMSELLDNQISIMKRLGIIDSDSECGDGCDNLRSLSSKLYQIGINNEPEYKY